MLAQGCGCRDSGAAKLCHVPCAVESLASGGDLLESYDRFFRCGACKQRFSGAFKMGVSRARYEHVKKDNIQSKARLLATVVLAQCLTDDGKPGVALGTLNGLYVKLEQDNPHHPFLVDILVAKAAALFMLGPLHRKEHLDTLYLILTSQLPESDQAMMEANNQLSMALVDDRNGNMDMAESCARKAVAGSKAMTGLHNEERQIRYKSNLASVLSVAALRACGQADKTGRACARAGELFAEALEITEGMSARAAGVFGADHEISMKVMTTTATVIVQSKATARYEEAVENIRRTYEIRLAKLGKDHRDTADSLQNLIGVLLRTKAKCLYPECQSLASVLGSKARYTMCPRCQVARYCCERCRQADEARHKASGNCFRKSAAKNAKRT